MAKIRDLLEAWPINVEGFEADPEFPNIYQVTASTGERYILKNVGGLNDTISPLGLQHRVTQYLHRSGVPIAYLLTTQSGGFHATEGADAFILMPRLEREKTNLYADGAGPIYYNIGRQHRPMEPWRSGQHLRRRRWATSCVSAWHRRGRYLRRIIRRLDPHARDAPLRRPRACDCSKPP